ncbi:MAG: FAD-binding protein, partial [Dehalococcoidia bacterium]|nr:FAD-binding protein [Dehalococcoidia bacterium]
ERLVEEGGRVVGVVAGGHVWRARAVVIASGGFAANPDLFARLSGGVRLTSIAPLTSTGDAIALTEPLGAALTGVGTVLPTIGCVEDPDRPGRWYQSHPDTWDVLINAVPQNRPPAEIWVNTRGARFLNEDEWSIDTRERAVLAQDRHGFFIIFDDALLDSSPPLARAWTAADVRALAAAGRFFQTAPTLAALAAKTSMDPATLEASVAAYNTALVNGQPDPLGKAYRPRPIGVGAFYALFVQGGTLISWAGLKADANLAVLNEDGQPIPGLYAVGEALGATSFMGNAFCGGMMVGPCLSLGRFLGQRLARLATAAS